VRARTLPTLALIALLATPALAQYGRPISEREKKGLWRAGPFRFTPIVQLRNAGVDTNPFLAPAAETEETEVVLRGGLQVYVPAGRRLRLRGDGWLDYTFFSNALEPRALHPGGNLRAEVDVSRFTVFAGGGHFEARERYTTDIDTRIERTEGWLNGGIQYQITHIFGIDVGAEQRRYRYLPERPGDERVKLLLDRDSLAYQGRLRYAITPLTTLLVSAEAIEDTFRFSEPGRATTKSYRYLAGFEFGQKAVVAGRALVGVRDIPARSAGSATPYRGPAVQASLLVPILQQRLRFGALFNRDVYYSASAVFLEDEATRNTYAYGQWQLTVEFDLPFRFVGRAIAGWQSAEYQLPVVVGDQEITREDRIQAFGGSLLRRLGRHARFGITALHTTRSSTLPGLDYRRWQYGLQGEFSP
jgi:hypothetical protein